MDWLAWLQQGGHMAPPGADAFGTGLGTAYDGTPLPPPDMGYGPQAPDMGYGPPTPPSLGASLEPQVAGATGAAQAAAPATAAAAAAKGNPILDSLRGVTAPKPPDVVKPSTPAAPQLRPIQAGQLFQLLNELGNPRLAATRPTTLGGALGIGRY
jgi:hypothetical protein